MPLQANKQRKTDSQEKTKNTTKHDEKFKLTSLIFIFCIP
jgi:hypothetical protein